MNFNFEQLDGTTRKFMLDELEFDEGAPYLSARLSLDGRELYPDLLRSAIESGDPSTLEVSLGVPGLFVSHEQTKTGPKKMRRDAAKLLAQSEFNRYYVRGICARVIAEGGSEVEVYRARDSSRTRPESEAMIGKKIRASDLLEDLRTSQGEKPKLLPDVYSGLSVRMIQDEG